MNEALADSYKRHVKGRGSGGGYSYLQMVLICVSVVMFRSLISKWPHVYMDTFLGVACPE